VVEPIARPSTSRSSMNRVIASLCWSPRLRERSVALLEQIFDTLSRRRRDMVQPAWRCLEGRAGPRRSLWRFGWLRGLGPPAAWWPPTSSRLPRTVDLPNLELVQQTSSRTSLSSCPGSFDVYVIAPVIVSPRRPQGESDSAKAQC